MKTRMFQQILTLTCMGFLWTGCQSGPFASRSDSPRKALVERSPETEEESAMQKKLREAMAQERSKARRHRLRDELKSEVSPEQLAALKGSEQQIVQTAAKVEAQALPLSDLQAAASQSAAPQTDASSLQRELNQAYEADRSGNLEKALGYYQRVLAMNPEHFEALHRLAIIEDKKQNFPAAEAYYLQALKLDPSNADLLSDIGYSYMLQGRDDYGEKYLEEALKYQPAHARSLDHLGWYYGRTGRYDQALAMFRKTSGEAQAREKFARLFPGVNPGSATGGQNPVPQYPDQLSQYPGNQQSAERNHAGIQTVGQMQSTPGQPVQYANNGNPEQQPLSSPDAAAMNPTHQIAEMMRREREKAIQARQSTQQLPAISPNPAMTQMRQVTGSHAPAAPLQNSQLQMPQMQSPQMQSPQFQTAQSQMPQQQPVESPQPVNQYANQPAVEPGQIQAWPPANDPTLSQAAEASQYWADKEQQLQNRQQPQQQMAARPYSNQSLPQQNYQGYPPNQLQGQYRNVPPGYQPMQSAPQQMMPVRGPQPGQQLYGNQYQSTPGQFPDYRSTQSGAQEAGQNPPQNDQDLMREVARTGMNMGPGQMFPMSDAAPGQLQGNNSPLMSSQMGSGGVIPASAQVPFQNAYGTNGPNGLQPQMGQGMPQGGVSQAGYQYSGQPAGQGNVYHASMPQRLPAQEQPMSSALPQSAMFSNNPVAAPANVRFQNASGTAADLRTGYQGSLNGSQNLNEQSASPFQWGSQPTNSQYQFSDPQRQY